MTHAAFRITILQHSMLASNFLVARVPAALARLKDPGVTKIIGRLILNLVEGEILQTKCAFEEGWMTLRCKLLTRRKLCRLESNK